MVTHLHLVRVVAISFFRKPKIKHNDENVGLYTHEQVIPVY
jgi:hypothetical protein